MSDPCPNCGQALRHLSGVTYSCPRCGLIEFESLPFLPICPECDYDLRAAATDRCPECGWKMNLGFRWKLRQLQESQRHQPEPPAPPTRPT